MAAAAREFADEVEPQANALTKAKASEITNFRFEISDGRNGKCQCKCQYQCKCSSLTPEGGSG